MDLAIFIFGIYSPGVRLDEWGNSLSVVGTLFNTKKGACISLLTNLLCVNGFEYLEDVDMTPLDLVSGIHKGSTYGAYLPLSMVGALIYVKIS